MSFFQSVVIDDASAAKVHKLLTIGNLVSNFPLIIMGLGGILLVVFILLLVRARKQKVTPPLLAPPSPPSSLATHGFACA